MTEEQRIRAVERELDGIGGLVKVMRDMAQEEFSLGEDSEALERFFNKSSVATVIDKVEIHRILREEYEAFHKVKP